MTDGDFSHGESVHEGKGGKEPVHADKELQPVDDLPAKDLERASGVVNMVACDSAPHGVCHPGRNFPCETIMPLSPPPSDQIVLFRLGQQRADVGRIVLKVTVHRHDQRAGRPLESCIECRRLSIVAIEMQHDDRRMLSGEAVQ